MQENQNREKPAVTLEQLLHVKRAERPEQHFWDDFDRELRRRQLATVVNNRPWYSRLSQAAMLVLRRSAPFAAAAAALAAGFVVFDQNDGNPAETAIPVAQIAQANPDNLLVVLPAEQFSARTRPAVTEPEPERVAQSEFSQPQFVVHQFELPPAPARPWKTVASPNVLTVSSSMAVGEGIEAAGWSAGPALRAPAHPGAGSF